MMSKTFVAGHRRRHGRRLIIFGILALLLAVGGLYVYQQFKQDTQAVIKNSPGTSRPLEIPNAKTQHIDEGVFAFDVPADWKLIKHDNGPYDLYSYHSTLKNADNRYLDIYADKLPLALAVNKAVKVQGQGNNMTHGMASENCTTFTAASQQTPKQLAVPAKWDGVDFLCDNDNTMRNAIGTSSPGSINKVELTGPTKGAHSFFFVYNDNNATPDYSIFYNILESFVVN